MSWNGKYFSGVNHVQQYSVVCQCSVMRRNYRNVGGFHVKGGKHELQKYSDKFIDLAIKLSLWNEKKVQRQQTDRVLVLSASALNANLHIEMLPFVVSAFLCSLIEMEMKFIDNVEAETFISANRLLTVFKWMKNEREVL